MSRNDLVLLSMHWAMQSERQIRPNSKAGLERASSNACGPWPLQTHLAFREREMASLQPARSDSAQVVLVVPLVPIQVPLARSSRRFVAYGTLRIL